MSRRAARVRSVGESNSDDRLDALSDFDFWLRADGHRRNPGTTADLITAGIFLNLLDGDVEFPVRI